MFVFVYQRLTTFFFPVYKSGNSITNEPAEQYYNDNDYDDDE